MSASSYRTILRSSSIIGGAKVINIAVSLVKMKLVAVLLAMLGLAPWAIALLYTAEFGAAVDILRWQLLGDILKVLSWPLGFVIMAAGAGRTFMLTETLGIGVFVPGIFVGLPLIGVTATGVAFKAQALAVIAAAVAVDAAARWSDVAGALLGTTLAAGLGGWALRRLSSQAGNRPGRVGALGEKIKVWTIQRF